MARALQLEWQHQNRDAAFLQLHALPWEARRATDAEQQAAARGPWLRGGLPLGDTFSSRLEKQQHLISTPRHAGGN